MVTAAQGDFDAGTGVVVALPASDDMSPESSAASEDLEEGGAAADDSAGGPSLNCLPQNGS